MKIFKVLFVFSIFLFSIGSINALGKKDKDAGKTETQAPEKKEVKKDFLSLDLYLDTKKANKKNHLNWKTSSEKYNDSFDAVSSASKVHSTKNLREATMDSGKKNMQIPKGLRSLCLFAVSSPETLSKDNFLATQKGKKITITFEHRGFSYKIESNEKGEIQVPESFSILSSGKKAGLPTGSPTDETPPAEKTAGEQNQATPPSPENKSPENKSPENADSPFTADAPDYSISQIFKGKLKASLSPDGILTLRGKLKLTENKEPEKPTAEK